jgi:AraC-like DNA-binding protein
MPKDLRIAARSATFIAEDLGRRGVAVDRVLREAGLQRADIADPETRVRYADLLRLVERAAAIAGDASYGLRLGAARELGDSGLLGFVMLNSSTLLEALTNLQRYCRVLGDGEDFEIEPAGPLVTVRFREADAALRGLRHNSDYIAALLVRACRDMTRRRLAPVRARFIHHRPDVPVAYAEYLGCPVEFGAAWDMLVFSADTMRLPVIGADSRLLRVLEDSCRRLLGPARRRPDLLRDVQAVLLGAIGKEPPRLDTVAQALAIGPKSLERRLRERGTSFSKLVEQVRSELSRQWLRDTDMSLDQIAYLAGYASTAAWLRAFKRWTGMTPGRFRRRRG